MLYGTTVVPIKPNTIKILFSSKLGINIPSIRDSKLGFVIIAVIKKETLIVKTKKIRDFSINL